MNNKSDFYPKLRLQLGTLIVILFASLLSSCSSSYVAANSTTKNTIIGKDIAIQARYNWEEAQKIATVNQQKALDFYYQKLLASNSQLDFKAYFSRLLYEQGFFLSGREYLQEVLNASYDGLWFYEFFSDALLKKYEIQLTQRLLTAGLKIDPDSQKLQWVLVRLNSQKDPKKALSMISGFDDLTYHQFLFKHSLEILIGDHQAAADTLLTAIADHPKISALYEKLIMFYISSNQPAATLESITAALDQFPDQATFYHLKAIYYEKQKDYHVAWQSNQQAIDLAPDRQDYQVFAAKISWIAGNYDQAAVLMQKLVDNYTDELILYLWLARYYQHNSRPFSAEDVVLKGLSLLNLNNYLDSHKQKFEDILLYEYAIIQERKHNYRLAILNLKNLLVKNSDNIQLNYDLARNYVASENPRKALPQLERVLSRAGSEQINKLRAAEFYVDTLIQLEEFSLAVSFIDRKYKTKDKLRQTTAPWADLKLAKIELYKKNYLAAKEYLTQYHLKKAPETLEAQQIEVAVLQGLAEHEQLLEKLKNFQQTRAVLKGYINFTEFHLHPDKGSALFADYLKSGPPNLAYMELQAYLDKSYLKRAWRDSPVTVKTFEKILLGWNYQSDLPLVPTKWRIYLEWLGHALAFYPTKAPPPIIEDDADEVWMIIYQAYVWRENDRRDLSERLLLKAIAKHPTHPWLNGLLVSDYINQEDYKTAIAAIKLYLTHFPDSVWAKIELSLCYDFLKMGTQAEKYLLEVMDQDEDNPTVLNNLAWLYLTSNDEKLHKPELALEYALKAVKHNANSAFWDTLAEAYLQNKQYKKAEEAIEKALILDLSKSDHFKRQLIKIKDALQKVDY